MRLRMVCATWIKDRHRPVIEYLVDNYDDSIKLSKLYNNLDEINKISYFTATRPIIVKSTIEHLMLQEEMYYARKNIFSKYSNDKLESDEKNLSDLDKADDNDLFIEEIDEGVKREYDNNLN